MRKESAKPIVIVSKCLGFASCRYNGLMIEDNFVEKLKPYVEFRPICAEVEIGLGVPRDPLHVVIVDGTPKLIQPSTGKDLTDKMHSFVDSFLGSIDKVDGFILKSRSPSCGIRDVKIYSCMGGSASISKGSGFLGGAVVKKFPHLAIEDERRLASPKVRERFLMQIFTSAKFRKVKKIGSIEELRRFHLENRALYNKRELRVLDRIVVNIEKRPDHEVIKDYEQYLFSALSKVGKD